MIERTKDETHLVIKTKWKIEWNYNFHRQHEQYSERPNALKPLCSSILAIYIRHVQENFRNIRINEASISKIFIRLSLYKFILAPISELHKWKKMRNYMVWKKKDYVYFTIPTNWLKILDFKSKYCKISNNYKTIFCFSTLIVQFSWLLQKIEIYFRYFNSQKQNIINRSRRVVPQTGRHGYRTTQSLITHHRKPARSYIQEKLIRFAAGATYSARGAANKMRAFITEHLAKSMIRY